MKALSLKLSDALDARLSAAARKRRTSKSALVRDALEAFLGTKVRPGSALELMRDLAGCAEGPGDLSYNKAHLRDYGKR